MSHRRFHGTDVDMHYTRMSEAAEYQERLSKVLGSVNLAKKLPELTMRLFHFHVQVE